MNDFLTKLRSLVKVDNCLYVRHIKSYRARQAAFHDYFLSTAFVKVISNAEKF